MAGALEVGLGLERIAQDGKYCDEGAEKDLMPLTKSVGQRPQVRSGKGFGRNSA